MPMSWRTLGSSRVAAVAVSGLIAALATTAVLTGCGSAGSAGRVNPSPPATVPAPSLGLRPAPHYAGLSEYTHDCLEMTKRGAWAKVHWTRSKDMTRGDADPITAGVTLLNRVPRQAELKEVGAPDTPVLVVSCRLRARIDGSSSDFDLAPKGWIERSLYGANDAEWSWSVKPKIGGTHTVTVWIHPLVTAHTSRERASSEDVLAEAAREQPYYTKVHVTVPTDEWLQDRMAIWAKDLNVAEGLVKAASALAAAVLAFLAVFGWKTARTKGGEREGGDPPKPSATTTDRGLRRKHA